MLREQRRFTSLLRFSCLYWLENSFLGSIPDRIGPISVPNKIIRRDERAAELSGGGYDRSVGGIPDGSKGNGFEQYFNRVRLHLKICGTIQLFRPPAKRPR